MSEGADGGGTAGPGGGRAPLLLTGRDLSPRALLAAAAPGGRVAVAAEARARMARSRAVIEEAVARRRPVYGVTTGLGSKVTEALPEAELGAFALATLRGRAHASGPALPAATVRAAMIVRANTLLTGAAGASPALADGLVAAVNAGLTPVVGAIGSVGVADLLPGATMGLALAGAGGLVAFGGRVLPAAEGLAAAGLAPLPLGPRDGLALASHAAFGAAEAAAALVAAETAMAGLAAAAALSLAAFRANLSPFRPEVLALRPQPGEAEAAAAILARLAGSAAAAPGAARRLQDPLSFRNLPQVHGAALFALSGLARVVAGELNGATDNPVVLEATAEVVSSGNYHTPHVTLAAEAAARGLALAGTLSAARCARLMTARLTDLPAYLTGGPDNPAGLAPLLKTAEAVLALLQAAAMPVPVWPSESADGVEDALTHAPLAARRLGEAADHLARLAGLELLVAAQAMELRGGADAPGPGLAPVLAGIRAVSAPLRADRPLGAELDALAAAVAAGAFGPQAGG